MKNDNFQPAEKAGQKKTKTGPATDYFSNYDFSKLEISLEEMFKSGVHFGHNKSRRNPKMDEYIFATKNSINIINLEETKSKLEEALKFIAKIISEGQEILLVGTKKQASKIVEAAAKKCGLPYVAERWLGGTFTNFPVISSRAKYLREEQEKMKKGEFGKYTKFEQAKKTDELEKMEKKMGGIKNMVKLPGAVFVASLIDDGLTVKEAKRKNVPVIALADTNADPSDASWIIPANDDAVSSIKLVLAYVIKTVLDAKNKITEAKKAEKAELDKK